MVKEKETACKNALKESILKYHPSLDFSVNGYQDDSICLKKFNGEWMVFIGYRGEETDEKFFPNIVEACLYMIKKLSAGDYDLQKKISDLFLDRIVSAELGKAA